MTFARVCELEPGMRFASYAGGGVFTWRGVEPIVSRFAGKRRVRVLTREGRSWVANVSDRVVLMGSDA